MTLTKKEEIIKRGCKQNPEIILPTSTLMKTLCDLENSEIASNHYKVHKLGIDEATKRAKEFLNSNFKLHDVLTSKEIKVCGKSYSFIHQVSPYKIPISYVESEDIFSGSIVEYFPKDISNIIFKSICLNNIITEHTSVQYVHELTHTQVDSQDGCITNYYDAEFLSIFLELVHAYQVDTTENLLKINDSRRILEMLTISEQLLSIPRTFEDTLIEDSKYLNSSLKAYNLFISYYYGSTSLRKEILDTARKVIGGNITLDDMLRKYEITYENSQDEKKLKKYFYR